MPKSADTEPEAEPLTPKEEAIARNAKWMKTAGIGIGIGSAAIVAAMLYTNRGKAKKG